MLGYPAHRRIQGGFYCTIFATFSSSVKRGRRGESPWGWCYESNGSFRDWQLDSLHDARDLWSVVTTNFYFPSSAMLRLRSCVCARAQLSEKGRKWKRGRRVMMKTIREILRDCFTLPWKRIGEERKIIRDIIGKICAANTLFEISPISDAFRILFQKNWNVKFVSKDARSEQIVLQNWKLIKKHIFSAIYCHGYINTANTMFYNKEFYLTSLLHLVHVGGFQTPPPPWDENYYLREK